MSMLHLAKYILIPLFVIDMAAMVVTLRLRKSARPEASEALHKLYFVENIIGLACCTVLTYVSFFGKQ